MMENFDLKIVGQLPIDTADHVLHKPSGETWLVAYVRGDRLVCCGWPESMVPLSDCELVKKASIFEKWKLIGEMLNTSGSRGEYALRMMAGAVHDVVGNAKPKDPLQGVIEGDAVRDQLIATMPPIDMVLHCPVCHMQHIDKAEPCTAEACVGGCANPGDCNAWPNDPHRSHLCRGCGYIWRPADVPTNGVVAVKTKGKYDSKVWPTCCGNPSVCSGEHKCQRRLDWALGVKQRVDDRSVLLIARLPATWP
jgi:hypothetical protein